MLKLFHSFLSSMASDDHPVIIVTIVPFYLIGYSSLPSFKIFFFIFGFYNLTICLGVGFSRLVHSASWICRFMSFATFVVFSHNFSEPIFRPFFLLSFQDLVDMNDRFFCCCCSPGNFFVCLTLIIFLSLFFLYCSYWVVYIVPIFRFTGSFLCHSILLLSQPTEF